MKQNTLVENETEQAIREFPIPAAPSLPNIQNIKAAHKATWSSGDFGQIARSVEEFAGEFMSRLPLKPGLRVLDAACGTGNLALLAARCGCHVCGVDIAPNLIAQARNRAAAEKLPIQFLEGDAEALPYGDAEFDLAVSSFGVMFAPRPNLVASELHRVTKPGGTIALASWTLEGFIGEMFKVFKKHLPPPPAGIPSPMEWGREETVRARLAEGFTNVRLTRRIARMRYPIPPAETVEFFRKYYGPTLKAFASLEAPAQAALQRELVELQTSHNQSTTSGATEVAAEYLEVIATRS